MRRAALGSALVCVAAGCGGAGAASFVRVDTTGGGDFTSVGNVFSAELP